MTRDEIKTAAEVIEAEEFAVLLPPVGYLYGGLHKFQRQDKRQVLDLWEVRLARWSKMTFEERRAEYLRHVTASAAGFSAAERRFIESMPEARPS